MNRLQAFAVDAAFENPTVRGPMDGTVAQATIAEHRSSKGLGHTLVLLEPPLALEPGHDAMGGSCVRRKSADVAPVAIQSAHA